MHFKTFRDLATSPLANEDFEPEKILLELAVKTGVSELKLTELKKILSLIHHAYHTAEDASAVEEKEHSMWAFPAKIDGWIFRKPSDVILKNIFKILLETDVWDKLVFSSELENHVRRLKDDARSKITCISDDPAESWRKHEDTRMMNLFEIWSELLEKITKKRDEKKRAS